MHFGLGSRESVDSLRIVWPDGATEVVEDLAANQTVRLRHNASYPVKTPEGS